MGSSPDMTNLRGATTGATVGAATDPLGFMGGPLIGAILGGKGGQKPSGPATPYAYGGPPASIFSAGHNPRKNIGPGMYAQQRRAPPTVAQGAPPVAQGPMTGLMRAPAPSLSTTPGGASGPMQSGPALRAPAAAAPMQQPMPFATSNSLQGPPRKG